MHRFSPTSLFLLTLLAALSLFSCKNDSTVEWLAVSQLDEISIACEAYAEVADEEKLTENLQKAAATISEIESTQPSNLKQPELVALYLDSLTTWQKMVIEDKVSLKEKQALALALHPLVEKLIVTAELPHLHPEPVTGDHKPNHEH